MGASVVWTDPETGERWRREGACNFCGDCCRSGSPFTGEVGTCPLLIERADGSGVCSVHGTDNHYWQIACRHWPSKPRHLLPYPRCGFRFVSVEGGG